MLELRDIYKSFGEVEVLKGISAEIGKGELLTFVGPSGCGKTTLLRIVGGFTTATSGQVILDGEDIDKLPPNMRNTKMVFQSYALFPHMNVRKNIAFGLKLKKWPKEKIDTRVEELLSLVHMEGLWPGLWRWNPKCCFWTSRFPTWMPTCGWSCGRKLEISRNG
jgi:ABC-type Fe3+/spermidine/putrescine transport system ATPase subunit